MSKIKLPEVGGAYGAPMGRRSHLPDPDEAVKLYLQRMDLVDGGYDKGGAYWGIAFDGNEMYVATDANREYWIYVRARDREEAKENVLKSAPSAKFFR